LTDRFRNENLGFFNNNKNFDNFYESFSNSIQTPTIVVDKGSDPDLNNDKNKDIIDQNMAEDLSIKVHNNSANAQVVQYLSPPALKRQRSQTDSISSLGFSRNGSRRSKKGKDSPVAAVKSSQLFRQSNQDMDSVSIGGCSIGGPSGDFSFSTHNERGDMNARMVNFLSVMYCLSLVMVGAIVCVKDLESPKTNSIWLIIINMMGFCWLLFLHIDIQRYKRWAIEYLKPDNDSQTREGAIKNMSSIDDNLSINTAVIFNSLKRKTVPDDCNASAISPFESAYRFIHGKHSGNFYLKCGITSKTILS
jgi:hypothetical protein